MNHEASPVAPSRRNRGATSGETECRLICIVCKHIVSYSWSLFQFVEFGFYTAPSISSLRRIATSRKIHRDIIGRPSEESSPCWRIWHTALIKCIPGGLSRHIIKCPRAGAQTLATHARRRQYVWTRASSLDLRHSTFPCKVLNLPTLAQVANCHLTRHWTVWPNCRNMAALLTRFGGPHLVSMLIYIQVFWRHLWLHLTVLFLPLTAYKTLEISQHLCRFSTEPVLLTPQTCLLSQEGNRLCLVIATLRK